MTQRQTTIEFFDHHAPDWDKRQRADDEPIIRRLMERVGFSPGDRVLDVGAGTGILVPFLERFSPRKIVAMDVSPRMIDLYRAKYPGHEAILGDFEIPLLADATFDHVVIFNAFPHFRSPEAAFARAFAALHPGGCLTIAHSMNRDALNEHHRRAGIEVEGDVLMSDEDFRVHYVQAGFIYVVVENATSFFSQGRKP